MSPHEKQLHIDFVNPRLAATRSGALLTPTAKFRIHRRNACLSPLNRSAARRG
jgi:hypothetical protein